MEYYAVSYSQEYLEHHGIKGMRWGVRRYQNYDGSYTQAGLKRFRQAESRYEEARTRQKKAARENAVGGNNQQSYDDYIRAKRDKKDAKAEMERQYRHLSDAKRADQGRDLYNRGITIRENNAKRKKINSILMAGAVASAVILESIGTARSPGYDMFRKFAPKYETRKLVRNMLKTVPAISAAGLTANAIAGVKDSSQNKKLRAYYSYRQPRKVK